MRPLVLGTAGHIDHGKTTLTKALTGVDTDRLAEEKKRGISIELGFAELTLPSGRRFSLIDVPGHERFVRTMLAGATGIDLVLLIVAADEGVKPQTKEHFEICRLLGVPSGIVVLTKADLATPERTLAVRSEVARLVRGSFLEGAPVIEVSAMTGTGIGELKNRLEQLAHTVQPRHAESYPRLPIDRVFTLRGHGTIITGTLRGGTLRGGTLRAGAPMAIYPLGLETRLRSLQVHGKITESAGPGNRVAANITGIEVEQIKRGDVLAPAGIFRCTRIIDAKFHLLATASTLKDRTPVHFHAGTMETAGEVRLLSGQKEVAPGHEAFLRVALKQDTLLLPGDRFILRSFSPVLTIGGGEVLDIYLEEQRLRRTKQAERLQSWAEFDLPGRAKLLAEAEPLGLAAAALTARLGIPPEQFHKDLHHLPGDWVITSSAVRNLGEKLEQRLAHHHEQKPLEPGLPREVARGEIFGKAPASVLEFVLASCTGIASEGEFLRLASHQVKMKGQNEEAAQRMEKAFRDAGLAVPSLEEVLASTGLPLAQAKAVLSVLQRQGLLIRVGPDLIFHRASLDSLRKMFQEKKGQNFSVPQFKEWTGVSRKYAIPLLEFCDRMRLTRRVGDQRQIL
ncbi:selenocysteine-specific translation elongation factor [Oscillatoria amoena NRMC-F 0135]|nr:selenocysteine-specific translation elongation factor [Oscillatoria amoena NRMC-F 0135]